MFDQGGRWDLNPRMPEPQSGALTSWLRPPGKLGFSSLALPVSAVMPLDKIARLEGEGFHKAAVTKP